MVRINMIILNTLSKAVTQYSDQGFQSITPTHAGSVIGLFSFGGDDDAGAPIISEIKLPTALRETTLKKHIQAIYVSVQSTGRMNVSVFGKNQEWTYEMPVLSSGLSRCIVGKGIRENYLGFGLSNPLGQEFTIDRVEVLQVASKSRRI